MEKVTWYVKVANQAGTTLYYIGRYNYWGEAFREACKQYAWFTDDCPLVWDDATL